MQLYTFKSKTPLNIGREHGEEFRDSIRELSEVRVELLFKEPHFGTKSDVFELALAHLPILKSYDKPLFEELMGISEGSGISEAEAVIINHYTDMRDITGCTAVYVPTESGPLLGQTWDIDISALKHARLFQIGDTYVFTSVGCLGVAGFNTKGLGLCINNLNSTDARVGLLWPALIRRVLRESSAQTSRDLILDAPIGGGRHFAVADLTNLYAIEASATRQKVICDNPDNIYWHTNHCLDSEVGEVCKIRQGSSTFKRYDIAEKHIQENPLKNLDDLWGLLAEVSLDPKKVEGRIVTCGAFAVNLKTQERRACQGPVRF